MRRVWKWLSGGAILAIGVVAIACSDASPTGPETAIPSLGIQQIGACAQWSCAIADCTNDPAIYGACCVDVVDEGQQEQPKPSCEGDSDYCQIFGLRCTTSSPCNPVPLPGSACWHEHNPVPGYCSNVCSAL